MRLKVLPASCRSRPCGRVIRESGRARELFSRLEEERFAFDVEIVYRAMRRGCRVIEVPVEWADDRRSRVRFFRDSARMAVALLRIRRAKD